MLICIDMQIELFIPGTLFYNKWERRHFFLNKRLLCSALYYEEKESNKGSGVINEIAGVILS